MYIEDWKQRKSINNIRNFILLNIETTNVDKCLFCDGSGLKDTVCRNGITLWNGQYCDKCNGIGYIVKHDEKIIVEKGLKNTIKKMSEKVLNYGRTLSGFIYRLFKRKS